MVSSVRRESIPITDNEASFLAALRDAHSREHEVLADLVFVEPGSSKAALLHAVFEVGMNEIRDRVREVGYQQLMDGYTEEELAEQRAVARRQRALMLAEEGE